MTTININSGFLTLILLSFLYHNTGARVQVCSIGEPGISEK